MLPQKGEQRGNACGPGMLWTGRHRPVPRGLPQSCACGLLISTRLVPICIASVALSEFS